MVAANAVDFEERADQLSLADVDQSLADGYIFKLARKKLLAKGAKLLVGPRGTGKTHLMRFTYGRALDDPAAPLPFYANFSRYLHLEPLLKRSPDALKKFHAWVVAKLLISCFDMLHDAGRTDADLAELGAPYDAQALRALVALLERGSGDAEYHELGRSLTIDHVIRAVGQLTKQFHRERAILLLDDAALSLTDEYLVEFFQIFRLLKQERIAPKASVYPGSTQYGPSFHASHEAEHVPLWLSVEDPEYAAIMGDISQKRLAGLSGVGEDVSEMLKYVAFGIPRAYLRLLREYSQLTTAAPQQRMNKVIEDHAQLLLTEFDSLGLKLRQFRSVIQAGKELFERAVNDIRTEKDQDPSTRNYILGVRQETDRDPLATRMLFFLIEGGMLFPLPTPVSHGTNRRYDRYIPHFAVLAQAGVFRVGRGASPRDITDYMQRPAAKHPIRRELSRLLSEKALSGLKLDLPACQKCGTPRINDSQRFCHNCGDQLIVASLFEECMQLKLEEVPGISEAMIKRIHKDTNIRTVGHVYASQNASGDLQQAYYIGPARAAGIIQRVSVVVDEFLS